MPAAISIENMSKRYLVDHEVNRPGGYRTLRETLVDAATYPVRRLCGDAAPTHEEFWALKDISFDVQSGEVVGIIGRNGAGKSTLLKILSRITKPTAGRATLRGRVGSLLEVGTGFHPELTGRENIYLNGSILGMTRSEIQRKFDEIVAFAGVEQFLDTPVKRYSSGMYVRLAFAVSAHLEPEILIVDEVLAVGDAEFQNKCLGKMGDVAHDGRTVLFVSHQLAALESLCDRIVVLDRGTMHSQGLPGASIDNYLKLQRSYREATSIMDRLDRNGTGLARFQAISVLDSDGIPSSDISCGGGLRLEAVLDSNQYIPSMHCVFIISTARGQRLCRFATKDHNFGLESGKGQYRVACTVPHVTLMPGGYTISIRLLSGTEVLDEVPDAAQFNVLARDHSGTGRVLGTTQDLVFYPCEWTSERTNSPLTVI